MTPNMTTPTNLAMLMSLTMFEPCSPELRNSGTSTPVHYRVQLRRTPSRPNEIITNVLAAQQYHIYRDDGALIVSIQGVCWIGPGPTENR